MNISDYISLFGVVVSAITLIFAYHQLKNLTKNIELLISSNIIHSTQTLLLIEDRIDESRIEMEKISLDVIRANNPTSNGIPSELEQNPTELKAIINISIDRYLRGLDRLCSLYEKKILTKEQIIYEYKTTIKTVM